MDTNKQNQPSASNKSASQPSIPKSGVSANATSAGASSSASASNADAQGSSVTNNVYSSQTGGQKSWLDQDQLMKTVNQLPQSLKDLGTKAMGQVNGLSTTQKVVGGALLVSGLSWLALRNKDSKKSLASGSRYTPKGESKWKSSSESVYRGTATGLHGANSTNDLNKF